MSESTLYEWLGTSWQEIVLIALSTFGIYLAVIVFTRLFGLRSFSKMSSFDFAATVAVGSVMASTLTTKGPSLAQGAAGLFFLYLFQQILASLRRRTSLVEKMVDNSPVLLMDGPEILHDALRSTGVTEDDLRGKLREANVIRMSQVLAVVLETTGDISVLHADDGTELEKTLLEGVRRL